MNQTPLDIKVIYTADKKRRRALVQDSPPKIAAEPRLARSAPAVAGHVRAPILLAFMNLLLAGGFVYFTWWPVDQFMTVDVFMLQIPVGIDIDIDAAAAEIFGILPQKPAKAGVGPVVLAPEKPPAKFQGQTAAAIIGAAGMGWLTLATISSCILALACGAGLSARAPYFVRRVFFVFTILSVLLLAGSWLAVISEYGRGYPTDFLRGWMGALVLWFFFWGMARGRSAGSLFRAGSIAMLLSAAGAVVGLYLWSQCGVRVDLEAFGVIGLAFVAAQWAYGVVLWPTGRRFS